MSLETFGRYQLLKKLAAGGMAQIYLARQQGPEGFEKLLVVKRILPHLAENEDFVTMFLDEARIAARLNHPNVVQIFDLGAQDDSYFIAMEFIHGEDLRRVWKHAEREGNPIPLPLMLRTIIDAAAGLDYAHKKTDQSNRPLNIVHRDISPQNILVSFDGAVKVVDFGIAKAADQSTVTQSGVLKGKYSYMSPEQAAGQELDARSDLFALGVVLYELLTNTRLFKRQNDIQTLNAVTACVVEPPSKINAAIPPELDAIVMKALAKDRNARFADARQFGAALERWLLEKQLPSSTADLAEFMHEVYADRLAREAEEGRVLFETVENDMPDRATPSGEFRKSKATGSRKLASKPLELTVAGGNSARAAQRAPTEASMPTVAQTGVKLPMVAAVVLLALLVGGGTAWYFARGEKELTPPPGERPVVEKPIEKPAIETPPTPPVKILTRFESTPSGAAVIIGGQSMGVTPLELDLPGGALSVSLTLEGYRDVDDTFDVKVGDEPHRYALIALKKPIVKPPPPAPAAKEKATVRFFGEEAHVECPRANFRGDTPPSDKQLPVGDYECFFSSEGRRSSQTIHVQAGVTTKVKIEFP